MGMPARKRFSARRGLRLFRGTGGRERRSPSRGGHPLHPALLLAALLLACPSCGGNGGAREVSFRELESGSSWGDTGPGPRLEVAVGEASWEELWSRIHPPPLDSPPDTLSSERPHVDLGVEAVVAVFRGTKPTGGYSVRVSSVRVKAGSVELTVEMRDPPPGSMVTQALTSPYSLVTVPRPEIGLTGEVVFVLLDAGGERLTETRARL